MRIRMLVTRRGTPDGYAVRTYLKDRVYDLPELAACIFLSAGAAEIVHPTEPLMTHTTPRLLVRTASPASEPLTLAEAKLYLRVDGSSEDALITDAMLAAREAAEEYLRRSLITQSWKLAYDDALEEETYLPRGPVISITSVKSIAADGGETTIVASSYHLNAAKTLLVLDSPVSGHRVEIVYQTGFGDATQVPKAIKQGMLMHIAALFDARGGQVDMPPATRTLYHAYREVRL